QSAIADGVEHAAKLIAIEQVAQFLLGINVERDNPWTVEPQSLARADTDHLFGIAIQEVMKGVEPSYARDSGDQNRKRGRTWWQAWMKVNVLGHAGRPLSTEVRVGVSGF